MWTPGDGPSDDAWGVDLVDPVLVSHQQRLLLFARERDVPVGTLYFRVLDPTAAAGVDDLGSWSGWYRYRFPEEVAAALPANVEEAQAVPARELRLAGMDLLTVPPLAEPVQPASAPVRVLSEGSFLSVHRQSAAGTVLINRLGLLASTEDVEGVTMARYALEPAWEVRFRRSGLRDVPLDETDSQAYLDPVGDPFYEPTIELSRVTGVVAGAFDVARVPTVVPEASVLYIAVATSTGVTLHQVRQSGGALTDYTETPVAYPPLRPTRRDGGAALAPLPGLAPALVFYAEQEPASGPEGNEAELQRAGHLMLAIPVGGGDLPAAVAVYDFAVDRDGNIPVLAPQAQSLVLVDGTITDGKFTPDTTAPAYPTPADLPETVQVVDRLVVSSMLLGQVQPTRTPVFHFGDDGLVHLYYGGPPPVPPFDRWSSLDPTQPQAMVAQFDARANRLVLSVPWQETEAEEEGQGVVELVALQSGCVMAGATVTVSDGRLGDGPVEPDLCTVHITYPPASTLPAETWQAVPRSLSPFMDVLNGRASDDSADPAVLSGTTPFYDATGTRPLARVPLQLPSGVGAGPPPTLTVVSTRPDLPLTSVAVSASTGGGGQDHALAFATPEGGSLAVTWRDVPTDPAALADVFDGAAAPATYAYPPDPAGTPLFALVTDAVGIPAPVLLYSLGTNPDVAGMTVTVAPGTSGMARTDGTGETRDVTFTFPGGEPGDEPHDVSIRGLPADVDGFVTALRDDAAFRDLGLGISGATAGGAVRTTPSPVGRMGLAATAALFDVLLPAVELEGATVVAGSRTAGPQRHTFDPEPDPPLDRSRMAGFLATSLRPSTGAIAYVQNSGPATLDGAAPSRSLHATADADPLVSGVWVRQSPQWQCAFSPAANATVPVVRNGGVVPASANLRPQPDWTLEAWIRPRTAERQRVVTFLDDVTPVPAGAPALAYAMALESQQVVRAQSYAKSPGTKDSSFFQTGTSDHGDFMPANAFTWEFWVKPDPAAGPPPTGGVTPIGGVIQLGQSGRTPFLMVGLTADRHVHVLALDEGSNVHVYASGAVLPAVDDEGLPTWSHVALVGVQGRDGRWSLELMVDADVTDTFGGVELQHQSGAFLTIGANTVDDATVYGSLAQLRYWSHARSAADIRRTWLTSMSGTEPGLLGNWPLSGIESGGPTGQFVANTAEVTGGDWDAALQAFHQPLGTTDDSFFLSVVTSVAGLPAVEADAMLTNGRWNHVALVYRAGGALDMNPPAAFGGGRRDWVDCGPAETVVAGGQFAIDTWLLVAPDTAGPVGTIMARWAPLDAPDDQSFRLWVDDAGQLNLSVVIVTDEVGTTGTISARSSGAALRDGVAHHVAAVLSSRRVQGENSAEWTIAFYRDGVPVGSGTGTEDGVTSIQLRATQGDVTIGALFAPIPGAGPLPDEDFAYLHARLGEVRVWDTAPTVEALFPERHRRLPTRAAPAGLAARWSFRDAPGRLALDSVGGIEATLSSSAMRTTLAATSTQDVVANGAWVGRITPADTPLEPVSGAQFTLGTPTGPANVHVTGLTGDIAQVALFDQARSVETIQDQMYVPRWGDETALIACWDFSAGGADITGGQNDISPPLPPDRLTPSTAPLSNEGPYVRNVYGGVVNDHSQSAPGRIAVGSYADAQDVGTVRQRGVLKRQYVVDPGQTLARPIQIGELQLTYLGQVQTNPTLIGYIEGAPPVPSENLTRPFYLSGIAWANYLDTAMVTLVQEAGETVTFTSSSSHATQIEGGGAFGLFGLKTYTELGVNAGPFTVSTEQLTLRGTAQAVVKGFGAVGGGEEEKLQATWGGTQRDTMSVGGDWEPYQADLDDYLDPAVGRRFLVDNVGYALVESLTADLYALTFGPTGASVGTIVLPNPAIPPDRNIIVFPVDRSYTKNGTLDGKVGLVNDPDYRDADVRRGSYFKPIEAYALAARIEQQHARAQSVAEQFDPERKAHGWDTSLADAGAALSQEFSTEPGDAVAVATPVQGLVNRYVWTADGGLHAEEQTTAASSARSYSGTNTRGGGGGFHAEGEFFFYLGFNWSFDVMATHRVDVTVSRETTEQQALRMEVKVVGEAFLRAFDPDAPAEYGGGTGAFLPGAAPGKVKGYRFMTFYLPPGPANSRELRQVVDPVWLRLSNDASARALRQLDSGSPSWRVLHRVTYVERVPPPVASRPVFTPATGIVAPVNVEGNAELVRLVDAQIPPHVTERSRLIVGNAVAKALDPAPVDGSYPPSALEHWVPWWRAFLDRARPLQGKPPADPEAAALLHALVSRTTAYLYDGYASGAFTQILDRSSWDTAEA